MLSEALAVGLVVTFGENDRELVFNTGLQLDDNTIIIGTLAGHQQNVPVGDDREWVDQLEGGISLRSDDGVGFIGGYEVNAYGTSSSTDGGLDIGTMVGAEANLLLHPIEGMTAKLGAGYERIDWANGDPTEGWTANLNVTQKVGDALTLKAGIELRQSEDRYTAGTEFLLAHNTDSNSRLGLEYSYIVDKDGGDDDQRLTAYWRMGFGEASKSAASSVMGYGGAAELAADTGYNHNRILSAVMEKPDYLPANVLARGSLGENSSETCPINVVSSDYSTDSDSWYYGTDYVDNKYVVIYYRFLTDQPFAGWTLEMSGVTTAASIRTDFVDDGVAAAVLQIISTPSGSVPFTVSNGSYSCTFDTFYGGDVEVSVD